MSKVTINTESKNVVDHTGEFPIGHITRVLQHYVSQTETFEKLFSNMKQRIEDLQSSSDDHKEVLINELKDQLIDVDCWWEPESIWDNQETSECDMQLRHFPNDRMGMTGL